MFVLILHFKLFPVSSYVLQESCLAQLFYTFYVNDVVKILRYAKLLMYADGMSIYAIINNDVDRDALQCELNTLFVWCPVWDSQISYNKYKIMHFRKNKST